MLCAFSISCGFVCVSVMGTWRMHTAEGEMRGPFGNNGGLLLGVPCLLLILRTGCPSCNMITVTTIALVTLLQVNNKKEGLKGS